MRGAAPRLYARVCGVGRQCPCSPYPYRPPADARACVGCTKLPPHLPRRRRTASTPPSTSAKPPRLLASSGCSPLPRPSCSSPSSNAGNLQRGCSGAPLLLLVWPASATSSLSALRCQVSLISFLDSPEPARANTYSVSATAGFPPVCRAGSRARPHEACPPCPSPPAYVTRLRLRPDSTLTAACHWRVCVRARVCVLVFLCRVCTGTVQSCLRRSTTLQAAG